MYVSNEDKTQKKIVGGKNGFGFKLVLIWSTWGCIETLDHTRGLKYIQTFIEGEIPELYHIDNDPHELHNLALMPQYRTQVNKHQKLLVSELKRTNAQFVDSLPSVKGF